MNSSNLRLCLLASVLLLLFTACSAEEKDTAREMPLHVDFPADQLVLLQQLDQINYIGMRQHAWDLWSGITHRDKPGDVAVFESWYPADYVFHVEKTPPAALRQYQSSFEPLNQHGFEEIGPGESHISHVLYNQRARDHIRSEKLYLRSTFQDLNARFDKDKTSGWDRTVPQFPRDSIVIKPVWWPVKQAELTALPVWDGPYKGKNRAGQFPSMPAEDWPLAVAVIPPGLKAPTDLSTVTRTNPTQKIRGSVGLESFYYFQITQDMIDKLDSKEQDGFDHIKAGDYAVLIAMHVTTREINSWVWATYWWHDKPDQGHLAMDRPDSVKNVWANFLMNVSYSMDTPGSPDQGPHVVYNPYIEGKFPDGVVSNCMSCHNRASSPSLAGELCGALPVTRGSYNYQPTSPERDGRVKLEFLWSLLFRSSPNADNPACLSQH